MKAIALALVAVGVGAVGATELLSADGSGGCWSPEKIQKDRYTLRGAEGSIRSFQIDHVDGCTFRVKLDYTSAAGVDKVLDYNADFSRGGSPIFITYNSPP